MRSSKIAVLSICSNTFIVILKLIVGIFTGSVAIISEAIHSLLDLVASVIAFFSVRISNRPPDKEHPYGHGKFENISGTVETILIFVAGIWIIIESVEKLLHPTSIKMPIIGVVVMLIGALINWRVGKIVQKVGNDTHSVAMQSNALHLLTDVYSSIGVAVSLILVSLTGWEFLDALIGIGIAIYIMKESIELGRKSFTPLLDTGLSTDELKQIENVLNSFKSQFIEYHDLRTRRSGAQEHIDFHLVLPSHMSIEEAHLLCDKIEDEIKKVLVDPKILIHVEPENERIQKLDSLNARLREEQELQEVGNSLGG
ncbi:cation diffusion facilitator family transporter [Bacillus sp. AFS055030]|uniref:cation diffusion facilitator family transporter n=1 Tax=Bacillus sp. AFS055030 TaxID=2033507 RepID=UPI000BFC121D|nr:cation diffusion facilitator family transporter [Bacillus sp. AFS055030]PGL70722.1 cation-efflux pump [Bacillus sp. AFS055030]